MLLAVVVMSACARLTPPPTPTPTATDLPPTATAVPATATPEATETPVPTATPTPIPATATPTQAPAEAPAEAPTVTAVPTAGVTDGAASAAGAMPRSAADRQLFNGDFAGAIAGFEQQIAAAADEAAANEARFGLGKAQSLDGDANSAIATFAGLSTKDDFAATHPEVFYWLGRALAAQGQAPAAAAAFESYAVRRPLLADQAHEAAGRALAAAALYPEAIASYEKALAHAGSQVAALRARELMAAAHSNAGDSEAAIAQYQAILAEARNADYRAEILYLLGAAQNTAGQSDAAWENWRQALATQPDGRYGYLAAAALVIAGQPIDELLRARADLAVGEYQLALDAVNRFRDATPGHDGEAHSIAARVYEAQGDWGNAAVEWTRIIDTLPADARAGDAWLGLGRSEWRQGDTTSARATYLKAADSVANREAAATALWWAGWLAERDEDTLIEAVDAYQKLAQTYPESTYAAQAGFRAGLAAYRAGDLVQARERWTAHAASGSSLWHAASEFWLGKVLEAEGQNQAALDHWASMANRWSQDVYYGLIAAQKVAASRGDVFPQPAVDNGEDDLGSLAAWLQGWAGAVTPASLAVSLAGDESGDFARAAEWRRIGEDGMARTALETLRTRWNEDAVNLTRLAIASRDLGVYDVSIRAAARVMALSGQPLAGTPLALQRLIYPLYFSDLILPAAARYDLDPHSFLALVRQESLFGAIATSTAAARGLTQVIPSTGRGIAEQLRWPNYTDELLYRPYVSVEFGTYYLSRSLEASGGNLLQALAGYNGGPGNAGVWRRLAGRDDDLFVEVISFPETQTYVRAIAVQDNHFRRIYPDLTTTIP